MVTMVTVSILTVTIATVTVATVAKDFFPLVTVAKNCSSIHKFFSFFNFYYIQNWFKKFLFFLSVLGKKGSNRNI